MNLSELAYQEKRKMEMLQAKMRGLRIGDDGNMLIGKRRSNGGMEFYIKRKGSSQRKYIDRESQEMIPMLLRDRFASESLKVLEKNDKALAAFLADYQEFDPEIVMSGLPKTYQYAREFCEKNGLILPSAQRKNRFRESEKTSSPLELKHSTTFGLRVRSKGEAMIAEALYHYTDLEFCYEKRLVLIDENGQEVDAYPDFTIFQRPQEVVFWEQKGMMNDPEYVRNDQRKMELYFRNGIYVPKNLIVTCDGPDGSTDLQSVLKLIRGYFGFPKGDAH